MLWLQFTLCVLSILQSFNAHQVRKDSIECYTRTAIRSDTAKDRIDYCNFNCGKSHIACNNRGRRGPSCPSNVEVASLKSLKRLILSLHNEKRNKVAGGYFPKLPTAARMARMRWDNELAYLAQLKALRCTTSKDRCFSTSKFENPGQSNTGPVHVNDTSKFTLQKIVTKQIKSWFNSSYLCEMEHSANKICQLTLALIDRNIKIGCGAVYYEYKPKIYFQMVCNYAHRVHQGVPAYKTGDAVSECKTGKDKYYKNLCNVKEKYV